MEMLGVRGLSPHPLTPLPKVGGGRQLVSHPCFATRQATVGVSPPVPPPGRTPQQGASHLGTGGTALSGTAGLSSFTLRRRTPGWWHVPKPGGFCTP